MWWDGPLGGRAPEGTRREASGTDTSEVLIQQARAAAGGEAALLKVSTLSASARLRHHITYVSVSVSRVEELKAVLKGKVQIEIERPDKFRKRVSAAILAGGRITYEETVNGSHAWRYPPLTAVSSSRSRHVIDVGDFERSLAYQAQGARQQFSMYALMFLIQGMPDNSFRFSSEGRLTRENGEVDVVRVSGPNDFHAGLLFDRTTHMLVGLIQDVITVRPIPVVVEGFMLSRARWQQVVQRARRERQARIQRPRRMRVEFRFSDRRLVGGISLPHRITTTINGELVEELEITGFKINRRLNPGDFEPRPAKPSR